ncbi:hypothetical protein HID58_011631 [Brassica napus]|uniref:Uncharacterized protein n=1 Tax=Brassica napus TaxID=3708 RepID=A0ABQ8DYW3_BRANA|nr:hypothetical protein HID58_011631 [Brassica napus]
MASSSILLSDLKFGQCCSSAVEVRLLRFWEDMNVKRGDELCSSKYDDNSGTNLASYFIDAWSLVATLKNLSG